MTTGAVDGSDVEECERRGCGEVADDVVPVRVPFGEDQLQTAPDLRSLKQRWQVHPAPSLAHRPHHRFDLRSWCTRQDQPFDVFHVVGGGQRQRLQLGSGDGDAAADAAECLVQNRTVPRRRSSWPTPLVIRLPVEPCSGGSPRSRRRVEQESHAAVPPRPSAVVVLLPWSVGRARTVGVSRATHPQEAAERTMGDACGARSATGTGPTKRPPRPRSQGDGRDPPCRGIGACVGSTQAVPCSPSTRSL